jgi:AraC-like DNA-binding protein/tetratricopeptide (TPR) repeat protein
MAKRDAQVDAAAATARRAGSLPRDVARAIGHLRANLHRSVPTAELAAQAGVAERTLHEHFHAFIGVSPGRYGSRLRLAAARRALQQRSNREAVTAIALRHGFPHLGRFAGQYRQAFGEAPSATRRGATARLPRTRQALAAPAPRGERPEVVIMPFAASPALADAANLIGDGIAATVCADVAVAVAPLRTSPQRRDFNAGYVLRGRVVQAGEQLRVVAALVDATSGMHLWGDAWDGKAIAALAIIDRVIAGAARAIPLAVRKAEIARVAPLAPDRLEAHELCLRAFSILSANTPASTGQALELLHRAIARDPDCALAAGLAAWGHAQRVLHATSTSPADDVARARALAARAGVLDPDDARVLTARSVVHTMAGEDDIAGALIARALARDPRSAWALERRGWLKIIAGDAPAAIACFGRSLRLDPSNTGRTTGLLGIGAVFFHRGRHDLAVRAMRRVLEAEPGAVWVNRTLAVSYAHLGERQMALRSLDALRRYRPDVTVRDVVSAMRFPADFRSCVANGLSDLGLPP